MSSGHSNSLDIHRLTQAVQLYFKAALSAFTQRTYKAAEKKYLLFCNNFSLTPSRHPRTLCATLQRAWARRVKPAPPSVRTYQEFANFRLQQASRICASTRYPSESSPKRHQGSGSMNWTSNSPPSPYYTSNPPQTQGGMAS